MNSDQYGEAFSVIEQHWRNREMLLGCLTCGALVPESGMRLHLNWHEEVENAEK